MSNSEIYTSKTPFIVKVFEACSSHISEQDMDLLTKDSDPNRHPTLILYPFEYGFFVFVAWEDDENENILAKLKQEGYSQALINLAQLARDSGCKFLQFDCDGVEYIDLPTYTRQSLDPLVHRALKEDSRRN